MNNFERMDTEMNNKVYVQNLPEELNEVAIREVFSQYGKIVDMYHLPNTTWAYITYETYREAEHSIRALDNNKSLGLKVDLAKKPPNKAHNLSVSEDLKKKILVTDVAKPQDLEKKILVTDVAKPLSTHTDIKYRQGCGRGAIPKYSTMSQKDNGILDVDNEPSSSWSYSQASNVYESEDKFESTNRLWAREVMTTASDGKRRVAAGRAYMAYEYPDENPIQSKTEEFIGKIYEKRLKGLYKCGEEKFEEVQKCYTCSTKTTRHCAKCSTYYCSRLCQEKDWPQHRKECENIPALVEDTVHNISTLQISKEEQEKISEPNVINKAITSNDIKLRRPNAPQNFTNTQSNSINVSKTERADQLVNNTMIKDPFQQNQRFKYNNTARSTDQLKRDEGYQRPKYNNTARNTDQSKEDEGYLTKANSIRQHYNRDQNNVTNRTSYNKDRIDNTNVREDRNYNVNDKNQSDQRYGFQNNRKFSSYNNGQNANKRRSSASSNSNTDDDLAFSKDTYLSNKEFTEVQITLLSNNNEYWIIKVKDMKALHNLMETLRVVAEKSNNVKPNIGKIYGVLYENLWHRAKVISVNPVMVNYIDFGNDEVLKENAEFRDIGDVKELKVPKFAKKIQLTPSEAEKCKNLKVDDKIFVRMLSTKTDGTIIVEVQKQLKDSSVPKESAPQSDTNNAMEKTMSQEKLEIPPIININASKVEVPNILGAFANVLTDKAVSQLEFEGFIQIVESTQTNVYYASLIPYDHQEEFSRLLSALQDECVRGINLGMSMNCGSQIENLVCGKDGERGWYRGYVLTSSDLRIIAVDDARIVSVDQILPCPEKFLNMCTFGVVCKVNHPTIKLKVEETYMFSTTLNQQSCKQGSFKIDITVDDQVVNTLIKPWETRITKPIPALAEIKSGSKICLTSYRNQCVMYARSLNESEVEYYNDILQRVALCALSAPNLSESPNKGQIVIAPFCDGNNYRAMVMDVKDDKAKIAYIDFGNIDYVSVKELKVLPEDLARQRSCSAKIVLKDVPRDVPMTVDTDQYLRNLTGQEVPLTCVYEGTPSKDGVYLTMPTGEKVNDELTKSLVPCWKRQEDDGNCWFKLDDIKTVSLGQVGDIVKVLITHVGEVGKQYMLSPFDKDAWAHHDDVMLPMMKEFCEKTEYYIPRGNELCLALYAGAWYRAACLRPKDTDTTSEIFFIDYGNIESVKYQNIRRMPKDFMAPAALANLCVVVNLEPLFNADNSSAIQQKIGELTTQGSEVEIKIVNIEEDGMVYKVEFSDVYAKLIAGNFIQSAKKF